MSMGERGRPAVLDMVREWPGRSPGSLFAAGAACILVFVLSAGFGGETGTVADVLWVVGMLLALIGVANLVLGVRAVLRRR